MKAIVRERYGSPDVLQLSEVELPTPADNEVRIKLRAASVNPLDLYLMKGAPWNKIPGLRKPKHKIIGCDVAGQVESIGKHVKQFQIGDEVFGVTGFEGKGLAEYVCTPEERTWRKPENLTFEDAAAVPVAAITALQGLRDKGHVQLGQKVLVEGASGGVGTFAVQIARALGAEVTAVCSTRNVLIARSLGADRVIDYTEVDFARGPERYDVIFAANAHHSIFEYRRMLAPDGIYVCAGGDVMRVLKAFLLGPLLSLIGRKKTCFFLAKVTQKDLAFLKELLEARKIVPMIDKCYPLSDAAEALRYLAQGHAQGKIVLTIPDHV
jgi:NADPH:quinone reductase-like Zn-dependent oxidoreductase